jgi:hypothetical protein
MAIIDHELIVKLDNVTFRVDCKINEDHTAKAYFNYYGKNYIFSLTRWRLTAFAKFRSLFCKVYDIDKFESNQDQDIVKHAIRDVFRLLHFILKEYPKEILDYAVWYTDKYCSRADTDYSTYIHVITCRCIVDSELLAGHVGRKVVYFPFSNYKLENVN